MRFYQHKALTGCFTALLLFYARLDGYSLLDNAGIYCPEQLHGKGSTQQWACKCATHLCLQLFTGYLS